MSFTVAAGEIVGLIGPNGAGKSTLINCVSRLYRPEPGASVSTASISANRKVHEVAALGIRRTFQNLELFREASVRENVTLGLVYRSTGPAVAELLDLSAARAKRRAPRKKRTDPRIMRARRRGEYPGLRPALWVQKSVELARALAGRPTLLLLDEPAAGMNPEESRRVAETVRRLRDNHGITVLLIEHDMRVVMTVCDRVVVLDHGEKIGEGTPAEVGARPR